MDKNIGEQLNKAYEAFRQACMDRDSAVKELQQKVCGVSFESCYLSWWMEFESFAMENIMLLELKKELFKELKHRDILIDEIWGFYLLTF